MKRYRVTVRYPLKHEAPHEDDVNAHAVGKTEVESIDGKSRGVSRFIVLSESYPIFDYPKGWDYQIEEYQE